MYLSRKKAKSCSCFPHKLNIRKGNSKEENEILRGCPDLDGFMAHTQVTEVKNCMENCESEFIANTPSRHI